MTSTKYRAWDHAKKIFGEVTLLEFFLGSYQVEQNYGHTGRVSLWNPANEADCGSWGRWLDLIELEQWTGLKDANGKEIFAGDFVKAGQDTMRVVWSEKYASFALGKAGWAFLHFFGEAVEAHRCEVVGNIHETPELSE